MAEEHKENSGHSDTGHSGAHKGGHGGGPHGGGSHEEHEGAPEWLISFADNVALMMGFFVILLAMNMQKPNMGGVGGEGKNPSDAERMDDFAIAMRAAFNNPVDEHSTNPAEQQLVRRLKAIKHEGGQTQRRGVDGDDSSTQSTRASDWVKPVAVAFFNDMDSTLTDEGRRSLVQYCEQIRGQQWILEVRGHTSAAETVSSKRRGMELAHARALAAAEELVANGLDWKQIRVVACADNERNTPRATSAKGHSDNQRAEIVQTQDQIPADPYNAR